MKNKTLAKLLGIKRSFNYEGALYNEDHHASDNKDILKDTKLTTREGHLD